MGAAAANRKRTGRRLTVRTGRPPLELAGEVDARILDAAHQVFLERGLGGATIEEIAYQAHAGKPTIYCRFPSKEALFTAVLVRNTDAKLALYRGHLPAGASIEERLMSVGVTVLRSVLVNDNVGLMRLAIAEARRFPELASNVHRMLREYGAEAVARLLAEAAEADDLARLPAFAPPRLATTTRLFLDLMVLPLLMRALFGEKLKALHAEIGPHVARGVAFFLAACRHGGIHQARGSEPGT